ncbi:MAG: tetratricopeptide repeat protein, partial [Gammaproteobacteria bacterium]|nr:tetratricopeptide repeat protein [Gammaproteobacteria bacterium]NIR28389.1 tetratricopeptide repeat protein [Gammaproteobacteria bacterium]NIR82139.1 tetratricopeptide repeat protein [Gammaproteobacteria bacterium]NIU03256.1 tetratricopeptide repeat protein [Gammaproteobacteria bacterium]NIV75272.1 tetratricopeptide repeat protein [Gammaproteobacteria bacterium]
VKKALEIEPEHPINHYNYAVILDEQGRHMEARERYEHVLALAPSLAPALYNMSCSYAREGNLDAALPYL